MVTRSCGFPRSSSTVPGVKYMEADVASLSIPTQTRKVEQLVSEVLTGVNKAGRSDLATRLTDEAKRWQDPDTTVVVAGEPKRGKSSLINALLGFDALLPVDADIATNVHVMIRHASRPQLRVVRSSSSGELEDLQDLPIDSIWEWASVSGNPGNQKGVQVVEVGVDHPILSNGLKIVDTPGVGGLDAAHAEVTLAALAAADALILVIDPRAPLTGPELRFLQKATDRIDTMLFALTKVDMIPGWRTIEQADRQLLDREAPRYGDSPLLPLSSKLRLKARQAADADNHELAQRLRVGSGFDQLEDWLTRSVMGQARLLRLRNLLQLSLTILDSLELPHRVAVQAADGDPRLAEQLRSKQDMYKEVTAARTDWSTKLADDFQALDLSLRTEFDSTLHRISQTYMEQIQSGKKELLQSLPPQLQAEVQAMLARLNVMVLDGAMGSLMGLGEQFRRDDVQIHVDELTMPGDPALPVGDVRSTGSATGSGSATALRLGMSSIGSGLMVARMASIVGAGSAMGPVGIAGGLLVGGATLLIGWSGQNKAKNMQELKRELDRQISWTRVQIPPQLVLKTRTIRRDIERHVRDRLQAQELEVRAAIDEHQRLVNSDRATRQKAKSDASLVLRTLQQLRTKVERLMENVRGSTGDDPRAQAQPEGVTLQPSRPPLAQR